MSRIVFTGYIELVIGDIACVVLTDEEERVAGAKINIKELTDRGISEADRFLMEIIDDKEIVFTKIPFEPPSAERMAEIDKLLDEALPDRILSDAD